MKLLSKFKNLKDKCKKLSKKQKIISLISIIAVLAVVISIVKMSGGKADRVLVEVSAEKRNIQTTISGTATVEANAQYEVTALVQGEVIEDYFDEGTEVLKGDKLYQIDTTDAQNSVEKARLNLQKAQNSYNTSAENASKLNVKSDISGTISNMYVKFGDNVSANTKICDVVDTSEIVAKIPFLSDDASNIHKGESATVTVSSTGETLSGRVTHISSGDTINSYGALIKYVKVSVKNPGSINEGEEVLATVGNYACQDSGKAEYENSCTVLSETSGTVSSIICDEGDYVSKGATVVKLESSSLSESLSSSRISLKESELSLDSTLNMLDDYTITAPISGTVISKTTKVGDTMDNSNSTTVMCVIADYSKTTVKLDIDELDLADIEIGQSVNIVADAYPDRTYTGYVDYISKVGTANMGATSYPVTIVIENPDDLIVGMNVSAEIVTESASDAVSVLQSAVNRGNIVFVKKTDVSKDSKKVEEEQLKRIEVPDGYVAVVVETGLSDGDYVEIKSGLSEGDTIAYYKTELKGDDSSKSENNAGGMGGGMPGGGGMPSGGGMPGGGGGMPGGGMSGGGGRGGF